MRTAKTAISEIKINGILRYRLTYPTVDGRKREHFTKEKDAKAKMKEILAEQKQFGESVAAMTSTVRADAVAAEKILAGSGLTLVEVARAMLAQKSATDSGVPISEAVDAFMQSRDSRSAAYLRTLRPRMKYISDFFAERTSTSIKFDDCQQLLDGLAGTTSPRTVSHYRTHLSSFFKFCEARGWITSNPVILTSQVKVTGKDTEILTPAEAATILAGCDRRILPGIVMGMFCGLRAAEIERLDWRAVDLAQGIITIGAGVAKTNSRRVVTIPHNARAWLAPYAQPAGNVWMSDHTRARDLWTLARVRAGYGPFFTDWKEVEKLQTDPKTEKPRKDLTPWPANALRHSAISYRVALEKDLAKISYESGNSPGIIQRHYNGLASPKSAKLFFAILPTAAGNVRLFKAA